MAKLDCADLLALAAFERQEHLPGRAGLISECLRGGRLSELIDHVQDDCLPETVDVDRLGVGRHLSNLQADSLLEDSAHLIDLRTDGGDLNGETI